MWTWTQGEDTALNPVCCRVEDGAMKKDLPGAMGKEEKRVHERAGISEGGGGTRVFRRRDRSAASDAVEGQVT